MPKLPGISQREPVRGAIKRTPRKKSLDTVVAEFVGLAEVSAKAQGISVVAAFERIVKAIQILPRQRKPMSPLDAVTYLYDPNELSADEKERALRVKLEAALLRLDGCCSSIAAHAEAWPTDAELKTLEAQIDAAGDLLVKRTPVTCWGRCERIDRYFPKLRLCERLTSFVTWIADSLPPRPLGELMPRRGAPDEALTKAFFSAVQKYRKEDSQPAAEDWLKFEPLLVRYQNAALKQASKTPRQGLWREPGTPTGPERTQAYLLFLELDRADLLWKSRHWPKLYPVLSWVQTLGNLALIRKLERFWAGTSSPVSSLVAHFEKLKVTVRRKRAAARKAKSRKKLVRKV